MWHLRSAANIEHFQNEYRAAGTLRGENNGGELQGGCVLHGRINAGEGHMGRYKTQIRQLTSRMGAAVSWMDRMWVMLCCAKSSLSRASVDHKENREISNVLSIQSQIAPRKVQPKLSIFYPTTTPLLYYLPSKCGLMA